MVFISLAFSGDDSHDNYNRYGKDSLVDKQILADTGYFDSDGVYYCVHYDHGGDGKARRGFQGGISPLGKYPNDTCFCVNGAGLEAGHMCHLRFLEDRMVEHTVPQWGFDATGSIFSMVAESMSLGQITFGGIISVCSAVKNNARMLWFSRHLSEILPVFERKTHVEEISLFDGQAFTLRRGQKAAIGEWLYSRQQQFVALEKWLRVAVQYVKRLQVSTGKNKKEKGKLIITGLQVTGATRGGFVW